MAGETSKKAEPLWVTAVSYFAWLATGALSIRLLDCWVSAALYPDASGHFWADLPEAIAGGLWLLGMALPARLLARRLCAIGFFWLALGEVIWMAQGYFQNNGWLFYGTLAAMIATLIVSKHALDYGVPAILAVNTAVVFLAAMPVTEIAARLFLASPRPGPAAERLDREPAGHPRGITAENAHLFYSYDDAHGDPGAFASWWSFFVGSFNSAAEGTFYESYPGHSPPWRLHPGGHAMVMDCPISINRRGFRGPELAEPKGNVYRIVCLGESTTFGMTFRKGDRPWPALLQDMINQRLHLSRPVEVVNAGIPAWSLAGNLERLRPQILPIHPDMLISYHGFNGFGMIDRSLPDVFGPPPPPFPHRPLRLLAEFEYRHDLSEFMRRHGGGDHPGPLLPPLKTPYADCYRRLIAFAQTNHIRLALANFSMAVTPATSQQVLDFYNAFGLGLLYGRANANGIHTEIVRRLAAATPGVIYIDTHPGLDGDRRKFIDVVHLTQKGRQQLAENMFAALRPVLEETLGKKAAAAPSAEPR